MNTSKEQMADLQIIADSSDSVTLKAETLRVLLSELRAKAEVRTVPEQIKQELLVAMAERVNRTHGTRDYPRAKAAYSALGAIFTAQPAQAATKPAEGWSSEISNLRGLAWYFNDRELDLRIERVADGFQTVTAGGKCTPPPAQAVSVPAAFSCPIGVADCRRNCGNYGCGN